MAYHDSRTGGPSVVRVEANPALSGHIRRIYSEYLEMPGLRLTCAQAQRLWGLDADTCGESLEALVNAGFLCRTHAGQYTRLTEGPIVTPLRMAKAERRKPARRSA